MNDLYGHETLEDLRDLRVAQFLLNETDGCVRISWTHSPDSLQGGDFLSHLSENQRRNYTATANIPELNADTHSVSLMWIYLVSVHV